MTKDGCSDRAIRLFRFIRSFGAMPCFVAFGILEHVLFVKEKYQGILMSEVLKINV